MRTCKDTITITFHHSHAPHAVAALLAAAIEHQDAAQRYSHTAKDVAKGLARVAHSCIELGNLIAAYGDCSADHEMRLEHYRLLNETLRMNLSLFGKPQGA